MKVALKFTITEDPLVLVEDGYLHIKTKAADLIPLSPNNAQKSFLKIFNELRTKNKPIRILLLKARQEGMCLSPNTKVLTADLTWVSLDNIRVGQDVVCVDEHSPGGKGKARKMRTGVVEGKHTVYKDAYKITLSDGRILIATAEHKFLTRKRKTSDIGWLEVKSLKVGNSMRSITIPWGEPNYEDGWFGGIIDGEGTVRRKEHAGCEMTVSQNPGAIYDRARKYLNNNGYTFYESLDERLYAEGGKFSNNPCGRIVVGRINELFKLFGITKPSKCVDNHWWKDKELPGKRNGVCWFEVVSIEPIGEKRMIDLQTSTKTFIAEGIVSHNSTLVESIIYSETSQVNNVNSLIIADEKDHASNLFEMSKLYHEQLTKNHPFLAPELKKSNEKKLEFADIHSQIIIATAENLEAAKSHTFQKVHLSECAYFRDFVTIMGDLNQTVPDLPNTFIICETTANGMDAFYDEWMRAIQGKTDWTPVFIPWFAMPEYSKPLEGALYPIEGIAFKAEDSEYTFLKEEKEIQKEYELSDEQINWRRYSIVNKCRGDLDVFNREYPACWQDAFQVSGSNFFNQKALKQQIVYKRKPIKIGEIFKEELAYKFRSLPTGRIKVYEEPRSSEQYIVSADASEAVGQDEASILVLNNRLNRVAAIVNGQYEPEELADMCIKIGNYYNNALVAPETKGYGTHVVSHVASQYGNIYKQKKDVDGVMIETGKLGFVTNLLTRPPMLSRAAETVLGNSCELYDKDLLNQCQTFIINPKNQRAEGASGKQDGLVICYDCKTRVLTMDGWKYIKDVKEGELIPSMDIKTEKVEYVQNVKTIKLPHNGEMVNFVGKSINLSVTPNHRMVAALSRGANRYKDYEFIEAKYLLGKRFRLNKVAKWGGKQPKTWTIPEYKLIYQSMKWGKPRETKRIFPKYDAPIAPFLQLIGFYIAEGCSNKNRVTLAQMPKSKGYEPIIKTLEALGLKYSIPKRKETIEVNNSQLARYIKELVPGLCYEKRIPKEILGLHPKLLRHLYDYMMLGDGCDDRIYVTTSPGLKDDFMELINKLGWSGTSNEVNKIGQKCMGKYHSKRLVYVISINRRDIKPRINHDEYFGKQCFTEDYTGEVYCLQLEKNHTLLVEREGKTCWSGNCFAIAQQVRHEHPYQVSSISNMQEIKAKRRIETNHAVGSKF